jgi:hypothetical protein
MTSLLDAERGRALDSRLSSNSSTGSSSSSAGVVKSNKSFAPPSFLNGYNDESGHDELSEAARIKSDNDDALKKKKNSTHYGVMPKNVKWGALPEEREEIAKEKALLEDMKNNLRVSHVSLSYDETTRYERSSMQADHSQYLKSQPTPRERNEEKRRQQYSSSNIFHNEEEERQMNYRSNARDGMIRHSRKANEQPSELQKHSAAASEGIWPPPLEGDFQDSQHKLNQIRDQASPQTLAENALSRAEEVQRIKTKMNGNDVKTMLTTPRSGEKDDSFSDYKKDRLMGYPASPEMLAANAITRAQEVRRIQAKMNGNQVKTLIS